MALDRQTIEKRDFPIGRRGYEPEAVDAHLARIAEDVDELRRRTASGSGGAVPRNSPASIAQAASEQVRSIVEAAEAGAAEIERAAQDEAERIRSEAEADARETRDEALSQSQQHVGKVRGATAQMLQRVDAMESELTGLLDSLRTGANRLTSDLALLETGMADLYDAAGRSRDAAPPRVVESVPAVVAADAPAPSAADAHADEEPAEAPIAVEEPALEVHAARADHEPAAGGGDVEGARLVALNMALNGTAREETDRYLAENFDLDDRDALLDEVYASVEG
jgi:DivIVA domain-containing protein